MGLRSALAKALRSGAAEGEYVVGDAMRRARANGYVVDAYRGAIRPYDETAAREARWFSRRPDTANTYAEVGSGQGPNNVMPAKLRLGRTARINARGKSWDQLRASMAPMAIRSRKEFRDILSDRRADVMEDIARARYLRDFAAAPALLRDFINPEVASWEIANVARKAQFDSVHFRRMRDSALGDDDIAPDDIYAVFDPSNIRSRFAQFRDPGSPNPTAAIVGGALGGEALRRALAARLSQQQEA